MTRLPINLQRYGDCPGRGLLHGLDRLCHLLPVSMADLKQRSSRSGNSDRREIPKERSSGNLRSRLTSLLAPPFFHFFLWGNFFIPGPPSVLNYIPQPNQKKGAGVFPPQGRKTVDWGERRILTAASSFLVGGGRSGHGRVLGPLDQLRTIASSVSGDAGIENFSFDTPEFALPLGLARRRFPAQGPLSPFNPGF